MNQHYICRPARIPHLTSSTDSTLLAASLDLTSVVVFPTEEKSLSDCAELAEILSTRSPRKCDLKCIVYLKLNRFVSKNKLQNQLKNINICSAVVPNIV